MAPLIRPIEDDNASVFAVEDTRDLKDAGSDSVRHGPFASVEAAKLWIAQELAEVEDLRSVPRLQ